MGCGFNWSMQHLISKYREEDVEDEVSTKDLLHRRTEGIDVGSLAKKVRLFTQLPGYLTGIIHRFGASWRQPVVYGRQSGNAHDWH